MTTTKHECRHARGIPHDTLDAHLASHALTRRLIAMFLLGTIPAVCRAQELRVRVMDSIGVLPVARALVTARRDDGRSELHGLTNDAGRVTFRLSAAGNWSVAVRRIGLEPRTTAPRMVRDGAVVDIDVTTRSVRFTLPPSRVVASGGDCQRETESHDRTSRIWEQVTLALRASALAEQARSTTMRAVTYDRELDRSLKVVSESPVQVRRGLGRPFAAASPESLAVHGYVRADAEHTLQYFAPDEQALLSEAFERTHCFDTPAADASPALAELRFVPAPSQRAPDIAGTAFVDAASGALRRIEFRFVHADSLFPADTRHAGGDVQFDERPDGEWIVAAWSIRMPRMVRVSWARGPRLTGYHEVGVAVEARAAGVSSLPATPDSSRRSGAAESTSGTPVRRGAAPSAAPTGDQVIVGGKLLVATAASVRGGTDWRRAFATRCRSGPGVCLDSAALSSAPRQTALDVVTRMDAIRLFVVPDGVPAPPRDDDVDLAEGWSAGATLPLMTPAGAPPSAARCHVKLFLDGERVSAAVLGSVAGTAIDGMEFYPSPRDVPDGFRRSGNRCGTLLLWGRER